MATATRTPARTAKVLQAEFDAFRRRVVTTALEAKKEHGFCDEVCTRPGS
jgi:hypothetical protein